MKVLKAALVAATAVTMSISDASAAEDVVIVYDASGSMWGQIDGTSKIEIARDVMADLVTGWSDDINLGLVAYGHRSEGDCRDIETLIEPGPLDRASFISTVNRIRPKGKTPISAAVQHAAELLSYRDNPATVVLISDGLETCQADPCALAEQLARQGVKFTTHVVGFDLEDQAHESLACIAENTGGVFVPAQNSDELKAALAHVQSVMDLQPMTPPEAEVAPEPEPEPQAEIAIQAPEQVTTGSSFKVTWSASIHPEDYVTIVPVGAEEGKYTNYQRVRDVTENRLIAPAQPGLYEVRYVTRKDGHTLGATPVEVVEAEIGITAPQQVTTGASFKVTWSTSIHPEDYVTIVPTGTEEGKYTNYQRVRDVTENRLTAPAEPGLYEVRYVLREGGRTMASTPVEVVEAEVTVSGPDVVRAGTKIQVNWSISIHPEDYVTIVPAGTAEGKYADYIRVRDARAGEMKAPAETGLYEIRYVLREGARTLASHQLEVVAQDAPLDDGAGLAAPAEAGAGETITVSWRAEAGSADQRVALARADQADFSWIAAHKVGAEKSLELQMPAQAGTYEIRFLDVSGRKVLGRAIVEVK